MPINVLVYDGPGVSQTSLTHTLFSLRTLLRPNYSVNPITPQALTSDPWPPSCALLVIPGGRDLPYVTALGKANPRIREYVEKGGSFLAFCAGAYYASKRVEWEVGTPLEVKGDRALGFFPGTAKGCAYKGFVYESEDGARAISVKVNENDGSTKTYEGIYYNGGGMFVEAEKFQPQGVRVLATYADGEHSGEPAAVVCDVGEGRAILWGPHPEYPLDRQPAAAALEKDASRPQESQITLLESSRWALLKSTLELLGLRVPLKSTEDASKDSVGPLPQILVVAPTKPFIMTHFREAVQNTCSSTTTPSLLEDANDTFRFSGAQDLSQLLIEARARRLVEEELASMTREVVMFDAGILPETTTTPIFNLRRYFDTLFAVRSSLALDRNAEPGTWGMGEALLYGEVVTSTQTLFDKNPIVQREMPTPLLSLASHQLTGRGRGGNTWLSPAGCLQFSLLLRPPRGFKPTSLVFIQYLFGLAVVEACRKAMPAGSGEAVRLKWPNDIYAVVKSDKDGKDELKKLGGILVTTNFSAGMIDVVIGCGLNVLNPLPTTSLSQLLPVGAEPLTTEAVAANIMPVFEQMWQRFVLNGGTFEPFVGLYLERWLHSDQLVTLTTTTPHQEVRIVGITSDYGLLRTVPVGDEIRFGADRYIDLQPDGNSFDMMAGLIRLKS